MKTTLIAVVLLTSTIVLTGCCRSGCDGGWGTSYAYTGSSCCASSCCGSGSW